MLTQTGQPKRKCLSLIKKYVINSLEAAIRRMTIVPAQKFQLLNCGPLRGGWADDIVIFDE
jgi:N-acyl-D-amino-acid deacylase